MGFDRIFRFKLLTRKYSFLFVTSYSFYLVKKLQNIGTKISSALFFQILMEPIGIIIKHQYQIYQYSHKTSFLFSLNTEMMNYPKNFQ
jgi:hypothetical protein